METKWLSDDFDQERLIIAGDIGGTNTNLAIVGLKEEKYTILLEMIFSSAAIKGLIEPIDLLVKECASKSGDKRAKTCCISAAGSVANNFCQLTNCSWAIDGNAIEKALGIRTIVINDFLAISYGILTLDINNSEQINQIPHTDGSLLKPMEATKVIIGPGTGLGVSFLACQRGEYIPCASEGGHSIFAAFDDESTALKKFVHDKTGTVPGIELFVSGQGINNIYNFFKEIKGLKTEGIIADIEKAGPNVRPALIAGNVNTNTACREMMELFVRMLATCSSNYACIFMPFGGLYLAGGTAIKNQSILIEKDLFMIHFEQNYQSHMRDVLKQVPVFIIKDYSISLYGAANAAVSLL